MGRVFVLLLCLSLNSEGKTVKEAADSSAHEVSVRVSLNGTGHVACGLTGDDVTKYHVDWYVHTDESGAFGHHIKKHHGRLLPLPHKVTSSCKRQGSKYTCCVRHKSHDHHEGHRNCGALYVEQYKACKNPSAPCKINKKGAEYSGRVSKTRSGRTCQRWGQQTPHRHTRNDAAKFPDESLVDAANYCRNPDNASEGPWCYTMDENTRWEYCDVPLCPGFQKSPMDNSENGIIRVDRHLRLTCQAADPTATVEWYRNGERLYAGRRLVVRRFTAANAGNYTCRVYSGALYLHEAGADAQQTCYTEQSVYALPRDCGVWDQQSNPDHMPWSVILRNKWTLEEYCRGSIVHEDWILTAAHCLKGEMASRLRVDQHHVTNIQVVLVTGQGTLQRHVTGYATHPHHTQGRFAADVVLLRLGFPFAFGSQLTPVCLPRDNVEQQFLLRGGRAEAVLDRGYSTGGLSVQPESVCGSEKHAEYDPDIMLCANSSKSTSAAAAAPVSCTGDSGSALVVRSHDKWFLTGVVSWAPGACADTVYLARVSAYADWIANRLIGKHDSDKSKCGFQ